MSSAVSTLFRFIPCLLILAISSSGCEKRTKTEEVEEKSAEADSVIHIPASALSGSALRVESVVERTISDTLSLNGQVEADPLRVAHLAPRVSGTIRQVNVVIGNRVGAGQSVAELYSPEFAAATGDYLLAHRRLEKAREARAADISSLEGITQSARLRLETLGAANSDIARIEERHEPLQNLPLRSPISGVVTEVETGVGKQVQAGADILGVADLREVWGVVDVYERDFGALRVGQTAAVSATAYPSRMFPGRVVSLEGTVKPETRTISVRIRVLNRDLALKPGMFITARVPARESLRGLAISEGAIQDFGGRKVLFVALTDSTFVPRAVVTKPLGGGLVQILSGIQPGERVASQGAFLVRSQASRSELGEE